MTYLVSEIRSLILLASPKTTLDDVMDWDNQPDLDKIADSNIGNFSAKFRRFFRRMLSIERYRPHSVTVLQKSQQRENRKPYQIDTGDYYFTNREWIFIN